MSGKQFRPKWKYPSNVKWRCMACGATFRDHEGSFVYLHARGRWEHEGFVAVSTDVNSKRFGVSHARR